MQSMHICFWFVNKKYLHCDLGVQRTVRSLAYLLSMYPGIKMYFVAPEVVRMKEDIREYLTR